MSITQAHKGSHQIVRSDQALPYATMQSSSLLTKRGTLWGQRAVGAKPVVLSNPSIVLRPLAATGHGGSNNFDSILAKYSSGGQCEAATWRVHVCMGTIDDIIVSRCCSAAR